jgi:hypothetical protein
MKKIFTTFFSFVGFTTVLFSQNATEDFYMTVPRKNVAASLYKEMVVMDSRTDTSMGIVQLGTSNKQAIVVAEIPIASQIKKVMKALVTEAQGKDTLLINLRQLSFVETPDNNKQLGYFHFRAGLYACNNNRYYLLQAIDTIAIVGARDVTISLFRTGSDIITKFIESNLTNTATDTHALSHYDISTVDNFEKQQINLYSNPIYVEGIYTNYASFKNQTPDYSAAAAVKEGKVVGLRKITHDGKFRYIAPEEVYAAVINGIPYVSTPYGYIPIEKRNNDLYFISKAQVSANKDPAIMASLLFGIIGGLMATAATDGREALFEMKIDHVSGMFIKIREITEP